MESEMRQIITAAFLALAATSAIAATVTIELPGDAAIGRQVATYRCGAQEVKAEYINTGSNSIVVLGLGEETVIAVNVIAASGAKYAGQQYVWWTKGDDADLYDLMKGEDVPPIACTKTG
jgi:membrane-bound inhibitor of C-type lysozyme